MRFRQCLGLVAALFVAGGLAVGGASAETKLVTVSMMENAVTSRQGIVVIFRDEPPHVMLSQQKADASDAEVAARIVERVLPELMRDAVPPPNGSALISPPYRVIIEGEEDQNGQPSREVIWLDALPQDLMDLLERPDDNWSRGLSPDRIRAEKAEKTVARLTSQAEVIRTQLGNLQKQLDQSRLQGAAAKVEVATLSRQLTAALAAAEAAERRTDRGDASEDVRKIELQNQQIAALRAQLSMLQDLLDEAVAREEAQGVALQQLGNQLNTALAQVAAEERKRREAMEALPADAAAMRERLAEAVAELAAMSLRLEEQRWRAEETLTLLAASNAALMEKEAELTRLAALLEQAEERLAVEGGASDGEGRQVALLNQQSAALRAELNELQALLVEARADDAQNRAEVAALGANLNRALAALAAEQRRSAQLETAERVRLEAEAATLKLYRPVVFGRFGEELNQTDGVSVVGERIILRSEVVFGTSLADVSPDGRALLSEVASLLRSITDDIPDDLEWIVRVDGHTDIQPLSPGRPFADNWELSQARALAVLRYLVDQEGLPPGRFAATGYGAYHPVDTGTDAAALARNRRIELTLATRPAGL